MQNYIIEKGSKPIYRHARATSPESREFQSTYTFTGKISPINDEPSFAHGRRTAIWRHFDLPQITVWTEKYREYSRHNSVNLIQAMNIKPARPRIKYQTKHREPPEHSYRRLQTDTRRWRDFCTHHMYLRLNKVEVIFWIEADKALR